MKGFICPHHIRVRGHVEEPAPPVVRHGFRATLYGAQAKYKTSSKLDNTLKLIHIVVGTSLFVGAQQVVVVNMLGSTVIEILIHEISYEAKAQ